jgi:hypothetical protein
MIKTKRIKIIRWLSNRFKTGLKQVWNRFTFITGKYPSNGVIMGLEHA